MRPPRGAPREGRSRRGKARASTEQRFAARAAPRRRRKVGALPELGQAAKILPARGANGGAGGKADAAGSAAGAGGRDKAGGGDEAGAGDKTGGADEAGGAVPGKRGICASAAGGRDSGLTAGSVWGWAGLQKVVVPQRLQKRRTPSPAAKMSASMPVSSIFSRVLQELQTSERRPRSISADDMGGKSMSQNFRLGSTKDTP